MIIFYEKIITIIPPPKIRAGNFFFATFGDIKRLFELFFRDFKLSKKICKKKLIATYMRNHVMTSDYKDSSISAYIKF